MIRKLKQILSITFIFTNFILISCGSPNLAYFTDIASFKDPQSYKNFYKKIFISANLNNVDERRYLEQQVLKELNEFDSNGLTSIEYIYPTRTYEPQEIDNILSSTRADAILSFEFDKQETETISTSNLQYNYIEKKWELVPNIVSNKFVHFKIKLIDIKENKIVWTATSQTKIFKNKNISLDSLSKSTVERLKNDNLI